MKIPTLASLIALAEILVLAACQSPEPRLNASQQAIIVELFVIDPLRDPRTAATPVIDVHTHTFNARYLPLQGIVLGKRDAFPLVTGFVSDDCARLIAQAFIDRTELAAIPGQRGVARKLDTREIRAAGHPGPVCRVFLDLIDKAIARGAWDPGRPMIEKMAIIDKLAGEMNLLERLAVRAAANMMGMQDHIGPGKATADTLTGMQAAVRFLWTITQNDAHMAQLFRDMHAGPHMKGSLTMVSHMMDLGPVYAQSADGSAMLDFERQQVARMEYFQRQPGSGLLYFVAYNPYRDHLQKGGSSAALDLVRDAITRHGAKGVKVYPPSGYRPAGNDIASRPNPIGTRLPGRQWDARYGQFGATIAEKNKALDAELNTLLEWCIAKDVPVFAHSGYGEFEARKGYGERDSDPAFWGKFLESHSTPGHPCKLRLCLGHAGGEDFWFGTGKHADWGRRAYELCTRYPNVYCEITTGDPMMDEKKQAFFVDRLATLFAESAESAAHPFSKKLMYGTDWYLPDKGKPHAVLLAAQKIFLHSRLRDHYADYFSGNARRYLKLNAATKRD